MKITRIARTRDQRKKRVAAYCRVSTGLSPQEESFDLQKAYYTSCIRRNPDWEFAGIYADERSALNTRQRPGFMQMIRDALAGRIDLILVKSISRFSRNLVDCENYARLLQMSGVEIYFEKERLRSFDPSGRLIFSLLAAIAQDESYSISENVKWSYTQRFRRGQYNLGNNRILGYDSVGGTLIPNARAWIVKCIFDLFLKGCTYRQIARQVAQMGGFGLRSKKELSASGVYAILKNETYVGDKLLQKQAPVDFLTKRPDPHAAYESRYLRHDHPPIISRGQWEAVQRILKDRQKDARAGIVQRSRNCHALYGKLFCACCGAPYTRRTRTAAKDPACKVWICAQRRKGNRGNGCRNPGIRESELLAKLGLSHDASETAIAEQLRCIARIEVDGKVLRVIAVKGE